MPSDSIQLSGTAPSAVKFYYFNPLTQQVYNTATPAFENWSDGNYANYGVAAAQQGTANRWTATRPAGAGAFPPAQPGKSSWVTGAAASRSAPTRSPLTLRRARPNVMSERAAVLYPLLPAAIEAVMAAAAQIGGAQNRL